MSYSDYGGCAYRNGVQIDERSDAVITDVAESAPGVYPGFAFMAQGVPNDDISRTIHDNPHGHAVIGDGPLYVGLYKQSDVLVWLSGTKLRAEDYAVDTPDDYWSEFDGTRHFQPTRTIGVDGATRAEASFVFPEGSRLDVVWLVEDNYYQYARLVQADGTTWAGWSGYGVGPGRHEEDYGHSTPDRDTTLVSLWDDAIGGSLPASRGISI